MLTKMKVLAVAALAVLATAENSQAQTKPPIKFGSILPLTGFAAAYGQQWKMAIELAVEDINKTGINGSKLEVEYQDDQVNPQQAILLYRAMANSDVRFIFGPNFSSTFEAVAPLAASVKMPTISAGGAVKPGLAVKPWALRLSSSDATLIPEGLAEFVKMYPKVKNIVVAGDIKDAAGAAAMDVIQKVAPELGLKVMEVVEYNTKVTDFSPYAIRIRGFESDAVVLCSAGPPSLKLINELETQSFSKPIIVPPVALGGSLAAELGSAGRNVFSMYSESNEPSGNAVRDDFLKRFLEKTKTISSLPQPASGVSAMLTYNAVIALGNVLRDEQIDGSTPVEEVRQKIMTRLNEPKPLRGYESFTMNDSGDTNQRAHLLRVDPQKGMWVYALPAAERIMN
jgi:branched-chain amino acid transport system substrate-binding protein